MSDFCLQSQNLFKHSAANVRVPKLFILLKYLLSSKPRDIQAEPNLFLQEYDQKMEEVFPNVGEDLVDFLNRCKLEDSEVMLCPRCSAVFDKKAAKGLQEL